MASISEQLKYILTVDASQATKSFQQIGATADKELGKADAKLDKLGGTLTKVGAGAVAFAGVAGAGLFKLAEGAANTEASFSSLNQVVGSTIANGLAEWAKDGAENLGLAEGQIFSAATAFGSLGKMAGFAGEDLDAFIRKQLTLSADMAAFADTSPDQVIQDLRAAYAGSAETLQKYNVFVNDTNIKSAIQAATGEKVTGVLTSQQRVMGINLLLTEQTADMQGQWNRESGQLAGQQAQLSANLKNLSDSIGTGVLPMVTSLVGGLNKAAGAFAELSPETQGMIGKFAALGVVGVGLLGTISLLAGQVIKMRSRFVAADGTLTSFGKTAKGLGVTMGIVTVALTAWTLNQQRDQRTMEDSIRLIDELGRVTDEALGQTFVHAVAAATMSGKSLQEALDFVAASNLEGAQRALDHAEAIGFSAAETAKLKAAIDKEIAARSQQTATTAEYATTEEGAATATDAAAAATANLKAEMEGGISTSEVAQQAGEALADQHEAAADAAGVQAAALAELTTQLHDAASATFDMEEATINLDLAYAAYQESVIAATEVLNDSEVSDRAKAQALRELRLEEIGLAKEAKTTAEEYARQAGAADNSAESARLQIFKLRELANTFPELRDEIQAYINILNRIPTSVTTRVLADTGGIFRNARGTSSSPGGLTLVGEEGPELVNMPRGAQVHTAGETRSMLNGSGAGNGHSGGAAPISITVNAGMGADGREIGDIIVGKIREYERRNGNGWRG